MKNSGGGGGGGDTASRQTITVDEQEIVRGREVGVRRYEKEGGTVECVDAMVRGSLACTGNTIGNNTVPIKNTIYY